MSGPGAIGNRLKRLRTERALSQAELAELADVSQDLIAKLEQGTRQSARLTSLTRLANALDVELSELIDNRPRIDRTYDGGSFLAVRDTLLSPSHLPWIDRHDDGGEPTPLDDLQRVVESGWEDYWAGRFGRLAGTLPAMIGEARITASALGTSAAAALAQSYQLAACLMVHMGKTDIAAIGAERALHAAADGSDELQWATLHGTYAWILLNQGRLGEAEQHAVRIAERVEPTFTRSPPQQLTVWGELMLTAMAPAAAAGREPEATDYVAMARAAAARLDTERHDYRMSFGPAQVAMQATHAYTVLGDPTRALTMARDVRSEDLFMVAYGRHLLDVGQAQVELRLYDPAIITMERAREVSPEWFRHQGVARSVVADLVARRRHVTPILRRLARAVGVY